MAKDTAPAVSDEGFFMVIIEQLGGTNKIDWQTVAEKSGIVSKGATSKRWSRLKLKYEQELGGKASGKSPPSKSGTPAAEGGEKKAKMKSPKKTANKKRKLDTDLEAGTGSEAEEKPVKAEEGDDES